MSIASGCQLSSFFICMTSSYGDRFYNSLLSSTTSISLKGNFFFRVLLLGLCCCLIPAALKLLSTTLVLLPGYFMVERLHHFYGYVTKNLTWKDHIRFVNTYRWVVFLECRFAFTSTCLMHLKPFHTFRSLLFVLLSDAIVIHCSFSITIISEVHCLYISLDSIVYHRSFV